MRYCFFVLLGVYCMVTTLGCASSPDFSSDDESDRTSDHLNSLWKQGYGFNNPNIDRRRKGLPPTNFGDRDDDDSNPLEEFFGDLIIRGIQCTLFATATAVQQYFFKGEEKKTELNAPPRKPVDYQIPDTATWNK